MGTNIYEWPIIKITFGPVTKITTSTDGLVFFNNFSHVLGWTIIIKSDFGIDNQCLVLITNVRFDIYYNFDYQKVTMVHHNQTRLWYSHNQTRLWNNDNQL